MQIAGDLLRHANCVVNRAKQYGSGVAAQLLATSSDTNGTVEAEPDTRNLFTHWQAFVGFRDLPKSQSRTTNGGFPARPIRAFGESGGLTGRAPMREQVELLNSADSPFFSIGCERSVSEIRKLDAQPIWKCTSYVQFAFVDPASCEIENYEGLARALHEALDTETDQACDRLVELEPDPIALHHAGRRAWSLSIWTSCYAADADSSVREWAECMDAQNVVLRSWIGKGNSRAIGD